MTTAQDLGCPALLLHHPTCQIPANKRLGIDGFVAYIRALATKSKGCQVDEPLRASDVLPKIPEVCPECHSADTTVIASPTGVYGRCAACGHVWHKDRVVVH